MYKIDQHLPLQVPPKFTQIRIFGSKLWHLATLMSAAAAALELFIEAYEKPLRIFYPAKQATALTRH
jgi:hypothetical protein